MMWKGGDGGLDLVVVRGLRDRMCEWVGELGRVMVDLPYMLLTRNQFVLSRRPGVMSRVVWGDAWDRTTSRAESVKVGWLRLEVDTME